MFRHIFGRSLKLGLAMGTVLGFLYLPAVMLAVIASRVFHGDFGFFTEIEAPLVGRSSHEFGFFEYFLCLSVIGGTMGLLLGAVNGLLLAVLTVNFFSPLGEAAYYHRTAVTLCGAVSFFCVFSLLDAALSAITHSYPAQAGNPDGFLIVWRWLVLLPALVATGAAVWASRRVTQEYEDDQGHIAQKCYFS